MDGAAAKGRDGRGDVACTAALLLMGGCGLRELLAAALWGAEPVRERDVRSGGTKGAVEQDASRRRHEARHARTQAWLVGSAPRIRP